MKAPTGQPRCHCCVVALGLALSLLPAPLAAQEHGELALGEVTLARATENVVDLEAECGEGQVPLRVTSPAPRAFRISIAPTPDDLPADSPGQTLTVKEEPGTLTINSGQVSLLVSTGRFGLRLVDAEGDTVAATAPRAAGGAVSFLGPSPAQASALRLGLRALAGEHYHGLGEKFNSLDQRGRRVESWVRDAYGSTGDDTYLSVPFFISSAGYGLWVNSAARVVFDFAATSDNVLSIQAPSPTLDLVLMVGTPKDVVRTYTGLSGRAPLPPEWVFLPWMSGSSYSSQQEVLDNVARMKQEGIPCGVVVIEGWKGDERFYEFHPQRFPEPQKMVRELHEAGVRCLLWTVPFVHPRDPLFRSAAQRGFLATNAAGQPARKTGWFAGWSMVDFSNQEAAKWWQDLHRPLLAMGVDGFRTDGGEGVLPTMRFANGMDGRAMHNLYPNLYNATMRELVKQERGADGVVWARSGSAGIQQYACVRAGDQPAEFAHMRTVIRAGLSSAVSGIPFWGHDVGGYWGHPSKELYLRWAQLGAFSPIMQFHGVEPHEPWAFDDETVRIYRKFATLRVNLLPYLYSLAKQAADTGLPLIRPLAMEYPGDPRAATVDDEFLLGRNLLIAPICEPGATSRSAYLPEGWWVSLWDDLAYQGGRTVALHADLDTVPVLVRSGSVIPMNLEPGRRPGEPIQGEPKLTLMAYPRGSGRLALFDGGTLTAVTTETTQREVHIKVDAHSRPADLRVLTSRPKKVVVNGEVVDQARRGPGPRWEYHTPSQRVVISLPGKQAADILLVGTHSPTAVANLSYPSEVPSTRRQMLVRCDLHYLSGWSEPALEWEHRGQAQPPVPGVHQLGLRWHFRVPLPGPVPSRDSIRLRVLTHKDDTQPRLVTDKRRVTLIPPVELELATEQGRVVGPRPMPVTAVVRRHCPGESIGIISLTAPAGATVKPSPRMSYRLTERDQAATKHFRVLFPQDLSVGEHTLAADLTWNQQRMRSASTQVTKQPTWAVIGPFDNPRGRGFRTEYPPERGLALTGHARGKHGEVRWRVFPQAQIADDGYVDLGKLFPEENWAVAYLLAFVASSAMREAELRVGSDDTVTVWLNDRKVLANPAMRDAAMDQDIVPVVLRRGQNKILIKVGQGPGEWQLYFRLTAPDGKPLSGLRDLAPQRFADLPAAKLASR